MKDKDMTSRLCMILLGLFVLLAASGVAADGTPYLKPSQLETEFQKVRYEFALANAVGAEQGLILAGAVGEDDGFEKSTFRKKSPLKAMLLSFAVPGAGQYYYGSRVKPFVFLGAEIAAWAMHLKWHGDGADREDEFEAFNRQHWSRTAYEDQYLMYAYGVSDDKDVVGASEVSHHLPDTRIQQYYEMTGKYDQFSWGWDDASRNDSVLSEFMPVGGGVNENLRVVGGVTTPVSAHRELYEEMRDDSNNKYDRARKMIVVSLVNRLISGFEAYFMTQKKNRDAGAGDGAFGRINVNANLRTYNQPNDTPFLNLAYKF